MQPNLLVMFHIIEFSKSNAVFFQTHSIIVPLIARINKMRVNVTHANLLSNLVKFRVQKLKPLAFTITNGNFVFFLFVVVVARNSAAGDQDNKLLK